MADKLVKYIDPRIQDETQTIYREAQRCVKESAYGAGWKIEGDVPAGGKKYRLYCPDMSPEAVQIATKYLIYTMSVQDGQTEYCDGVMVDRNMALACTPFRYEDNNYQEYIELDLGKEPGRYIAILPGTPEDDLFVPNRNLQGSQAYMGPGDPLSALSCVLLVGRDAVLSIDPTCTCAAIPMPTLANVVSDRPYVTDPISDCGCEDIPDKTLEDIVNDREFSNDPTCDNCDCEAIPRAELSNILDDHIQTMSIEDRDYPWSYLEADACQQYYVCMWLCDRKYQTTGRSQYLWNDLIVKTLEEEFGVDGLTVECEIIIRDNDNIYITKRLDTGVDNQAFLPKDLNDGTFTDNSQYMEEMYLQAQITVYEVGRDVFTILRSHPHPLTPEFFSMMLEKENLIEIPQDMVIEKPRFINRTIQRVYEMTAKTDSKSNIIQPVFFRTRDLANIVLHPAVTENICINLDAYKSQCSAFILKVEGVYFSELGRTASGIIFKIQGSLLPGQTNSGIYYVLDENSELITTGKYSYER